MFCKLKTVKILIITSGLTHGGVEQLILNILREKPEDKYKIDLLIFNDSKDDLSYKFQNYGCRIIKLPRAREQGIIAAIKSYQRVIKNGEYDIVHSHIGFGSVLPLTACALMNRDIKVICHAHFLITDESWKVKLLGHAAFNILRCTRLASSVEVGKTLYGNKSKFIVLKNGIDSEKFSFNAETRKAVQNELGIQDGVFVIGMAGRMDYQKNHEFLLDIFHEIKKKNNASILLLAGDGELRSKIEQKASLLGIRNDVKILGARNDVHRLLNAMDVFIMPTRFEGVSLALLEAQCSGLPCLTSTAVPHETKVTDDFYFIPLADGAQAWANIALKFLHTQRTDKSQVIREAGLDETEMARKWYKIYDDVLSR